MRILAVTAAIFLGITNAQPVAAAPGPTGIAFAQAEEGTWFCRDGDASRAFACALAKCKKESGGQDCVATRWCAPAGWSGMMVGWLPEFHATAIICGTSSAAAAGAALKALCEATEEYTRCDFFRTIDPDGNANDVSDVSWPGPATSGAPAGGTPVPAGEPAR